MNSELPLSADALLAERARLEDVLQSSEDWCELLRLKSRKERGEGMSAVNAARLEMVLIDALAEDPNFIRYKAVCVALERLIRGLPPLPPKGEKPPVERDDLTEIDGISASMQRRLNALDVTTFMQIAEWTPADVKSISSDLGLGRQIYEQDWIGQAEELATRSDEPSEPVPAPRSTVPPKQPTFERPVPLPRAIETRERPIEKSLPPVEREPARPIVEAKAPIKPAEPERAAKPVEVLRSAPPQAVEKIEPVVSAAAKPADAEAPKAQAPQAKPAADEVRKAADGKQETVASEPAARTPPAPKQDSKDAVSVAPSQSSPPSVQDRAPAEPPQPLKAGNVPPAKEVLAARKDLVAENVPVSPLLMPPTPLRVQPLASSPAPKFDAGDTGPKASEAPAAAITLSAPPRPLVVTRASLPPTPVVLPSPPAPLQPATPLKAVVATEPALPASAQSPQSAKAAAPSMSISEAIAYAAEVARQTPKSPGEANTEQRRAAAPPANAPANVPLNGAAISAPLAQEKLEPARPLVAPIEKPAQPKPQTAASAPARTSAPSAAKAVPVAPSVPPPLPAGFVPPPEDTASAEQSDYRGNSSQSSRISDRDDYAARRSGAEEATVEIVVKSAPEVRPTPRATLSKVASETMANVARPATPIGRFLKALTGN